MIYKVIHVADKILNLFLGLIITFALFISCYSLWDTYCIYSKAGTNKVKKPMVNAYGMDLSDLIASNEDVRAWLVIEGTHIDYPVVQGRTNMDYINTDVFGKYALSGSIFMDFRNKADISDFYTLLYGHSMENGAMFGDLNKFCYQDFFKKHTVGLLYTSNKTYSLEIFACLLVDAYDENIFDPTAQSRDVLSYIERNALQFKDVVFDPMDQIIGLSTCYDVNTDQRTVVVARLVNVSY